MDPVTIASIIEALASAAESAYKLYNASENTLSATDAATIHAALLKAEAATASMRTQVDAALSAASAE